MPSHYRQGAESPKCLRKLAFEHGANRAYEHYRQTGRRSDGRRFGKPAKPYSPPLVPEGKINVTDPDSREMRTQGQPNIQGYNAQAVVTEQQIIIDLLKRATG